jgi:hypothetical protein
MTMSQRNYDALVRIASEICEVPVCQVKARSRANGKAVLARQYAMTVATEILDYTREAVAKAFDRDHSTVLYGINHVKDLMDGNAIHKVRVNAIADRFVDWQNGEKVKANDSYSVSDMNDIAMIKAGADRAERALIALLRLDYAKQEIELPRLPRDLV